MSDSALQIAEQLAKNKNSALQTAITAANQDATQHIAAMQRLAESTVSQVRTHATSHCTSKVEQFQSVVAAIESSMAELNNLTRQFSTTVDEAMTELSDLEDQKQLVNQDFESTVQHILASRPLAHQSPR